MFRYVVDSRGCNPVTVSRQQPGGHHTWPAHHLGENTVLLSEEPRTQQARAQPEPSPASHLACPLLQQLGQD